MSNSISKYFGDSFVKSLLTFAKIRLSTPEVATRLAGVERAT